ncbi:helix-turn-helix domain-containing protein [Paenibacillus montanisoli]|uniref:AraC family transcriptional regulator n=1 Tax=Paenibacillus montanisoli TaxID=2081970 RepID=A0A328TU73_9BACL|nr:AraC family transcriptional regulator [Paenibacillus montanisoli]RAP74099.1 AraC family transcriptional regulator [Paenibacillus montanisoli]
MSDTFDHYVQSHPIVPYIRLADYAVREPWFIPERRILDYLLVYIQEGQCLFEVDKVPYHLGAGELCLIQPNSVLALRGLTKTLTPFVHMDIFYNAQRELSFSTLPGQLDLSAYDHLLQPGLNDFTDLNLPVVIKPRHAVPFIDQFMKMIGLCLSGQPYSALEVQSIATELVLSLVRQYGQSKPSASPAPQDLNWITSYFSFHLSENISVHDMARRANLSTSRFSKLFLKTFGVSPYQHLLQLRLKHANELLRGGSLKLHQIAEYCGFANEQHFSKAYKKAFGISPGSARKQDE